MVSPHIDDFTRVNVMLSNLASFFAIFGKHGGLALMHET
jgi:hypothetical protein